MGFDLTNQNNKCVLEIPRSIMLDHYIEVIKGLQEHANLPDPMTNIYLLTNHRLIFF